MTTLTTQSCSHVPTSRHGLFTRLRTFAALARQRRALARLDARSLDDLGLSRDAAEHEARRPIWDVPANWRR